MELYDWCCELLGAFCRSLGWTLVVLALAWAGLYQATNGSAMDHPWAPDPRVRR